MSFYMFPRFARIGQSHIAIYCRDHQLAIMLRTKTGFVCREIELPAGIVIDGEIVDVPKWTEAIREIMEIGNGISGSKKMYNALVAVPDALTYTHIFSFDGPTPKNLSLQLSKNAAELFPLPPDELVADWSTLPIQGGAHSTRVFMSAVSKKYFSSVINALRASHLKLQLAENESTSLARALLSDHLFVTAIIDIDARTTNISVFDDSTLIPKIALSVPIADDAFTSALRGRLHVDTSEAERMKREEGFDVGKGEGWTIVILQERVQAIVHEIEKAFEYYERSSGMKINRIILSGSGAIIPKIDAYIEANLKRPTSIGDPMSRLPYGLTLPRGKPPIMFATLIGLYRSQDNHSPDNLRRINFLRGWGKEAGVTYQVMQKENNWRNLALITFTISMILSGVLLFQTLVSPKSRYDNERAMRTAPLAPFVQEFTTEAIEISTSSASATTDSIESLLVNEETATEMFISSSTPTTTSSKKI